MNSLNYIKSDLLNNVKEVEHFFGKQEFSVPDDKREFFLNQVHGDAVVSLGLENKIPKNIDGDAIITNNKDLYIGIRTADCVPIFITSRQASFVSAIHAGWRGTFLGIVERVLEKVEKDFNCSKEDLRCAIGPSIGLCCYEVSYSMFNKFKKELALDEDSYRIHDGKYFINLAEINKKIINNYGVCEVELIRICTKCDNNFYSYRRDGSRDNNQISIIKIY